MPIINPNDAHWTDHICLPFTDAVYADNEQDAIYAQAQGFLDETELEQDNPEELDVSRVGNCGWPIPNEEI